MKIVKLSKIEAAVAAVPTVPACPEGEHTAQEFSVQNQRGGAMKNHYVINHYGQLLHRDTLQGCLNWCQKRIKQWRDFGGTCPAMKVFYDTETVPSWSYPGVGQ